MNKCQAYIEPISLYIDGALDETEAAKLEAHLCECPDCAALLEDLRMITEEAGRLNADAPPELHEAIMSGVRRTPLPDAPKKRGFLGGSKMPYALASAAVLLLVISAAFGSLNRTYLFGFLGRSDAGKTAAEAPAAAEPLGFASNGADDAPSESAEDEALSLTETSKAESGKSAQDSAGSCAPSDGAAPADAPDVDIPAEGTGSAEAPEMYSENTDAPSEGISGTSSGAFDISLLPYDRAFKFYMTVHLKDAEIPEFFDDFKRDVIPDLDATCVFVHDAGDLKDNAAAALEEDGLVPVYSDVFAVPSSESAGVIIFVK